MCVFLERGSANQHTQSDPQRRESSRGRSSRRDSGSSGAVQRQRSSRVVSLRRHEQLHRVGSQRQETRPIRERHFLFVVVFYYTRHSKGRFRRGFRKSRCQSGRYEHESTRSNGL